LKLVFCGGAGEVGASCYLLKLDGKNILLDCGLRMRGGKDSLPDLRLIQDEGGVDLILVSHAHLDHTGALPVISREYPAAGIYMTHVTKDLVRVLLYDSLKIMNYREGEIPVYAEKHVQGMLDRTICYSPQFIFTPFSGQEIKVTFYPAGHVAGAVLIYIEGKEGTLIYTGDLSATRQQTVNGAFIPKLRPDILMIESTYGDKLHSNREIEEERLIGMVKAVLNRGGKMLIPAFALGRAQEILLLLRRGVNRKQIPAVKVYVDGMIKEINRVYRRNPNYLRENLAKRIFKGKEIFYDDNVIPVFSKEMREAVPEAKEGLCVIASSGMLAGGPSAFYAEKFAAEEKNFIALTGYQDEEAPGRQLMKLITDEEKCLEINNKKIPVYCGVGMYGLSAHADKGELQAIIEKLRPKKVFLVHGDQEVLSSFSRNLSKEVWAQIYFPANGEEYDLVIKNPRKQQKKSEKIKPLNQVKELTDDHVEELWHYLKENISKDVFYSIEELVYFWKGKTPGEEEVKRAWGLFNKTPFFQPDPRRLFLYRPVELEELPAEEEGNMEMNEMLALAEKIFPEETGLYKKGARFEEKTALLYFNFPQKVKEKYEALLTEFREKTGWEVEINKECNIAALEEVLHSFCPGENIAKISYYREENTVLAKIEGVAADVQKTESRFYEKTGVKLRINKKEEKSPALENLKPVNRDKRLEQNKAFALIDQYFRDARHKLYKKSKKEREGIAYLELSFITPQIGAKHKERLAELEEITGWNIVVVKHPNQHEIIKKTRELCGTYGLPLEKNPSLYPAEARVVIKPAGDDDPVRFEELKNKFKEETGYDLVCDG